MSAGLKLGNVTLKNVWMGVAPNTREASVIR